MAGKIKFIADSRPLCRGTEEVLIDAEDWVRVQKHSWRVERYKNRRAAIFTDIRINGVFRKISLAKFIFAPDSPARVDRRQGNVILNYRKANLFKGELGLQKRISGKPRGRYTSRFKGVHRIPRGSRAAMRVGKKTIHIGVYSSEKEAARAYDEAMLTQFGEGCFLNFGK